MAVWDKVRVNFRQTRYLSSGSFPQVTVTIINKLVQLTKFKNKRELELIR